VRKPGALIVIEGIDGAGKSTQARTLVRRLRARGFEAAVFREPTRGRWGREIRRCAKEAGSLTPEQELELFLKDRRDNVERNLAPALAAGRIVVLDRYYFSSIAYQGAKGLDPVLVRRLNERFAIRPDLVFVLDLGPGLGLARIAGRKTRDRLFEREAYLRKVRKIFLSFRGRLFVPIDARQDRREIAKVILDRTLKIVLRKMALARANHPSHS
jgi:dTMP kinase